MPAWMPLDFDYRAYSAGSEPVARSRDGFSVRDLGKRTRALDSDRQAHFQAELLRNAEAVGSDTVPVFVSFRGERRRMDKGCVGHAVARGFLERLVDGSAGIVDSVVLRRPRDAGRADG